MSKWSETIGTPEWTLDRVTQGIGRVTDVLRTIPIHELPSIALRAPESWEELPGGTPSVYFLIPEGRKRPRYIGKAVNLRRRWSPHYGFRKARNRFIQEIDWDQCHAQLAPCLKHGNIRLHWLAVKQEELAIIEMLMIQIYKPKWNTHRS
jgi:excinuclease UvrABC nuclease subunit